jgi:hypothetical protein
LNEEQLIQEMYKILGRWNQQPEINNQIQEYSRYTEIKNELSNTYQVSLSIQQDPDNAGFFIMVKD